MNKPQAAFLLFGGFLTFAVGQAMDLKQSKFTQVVNEVRVISSVDNSEKPAQVDELFKMPDLVRTGAASRAELVAEDHTITRVGANTVFSFDPANRTIDLQQGSLLFHSPKGKGGGIIHTGSATASVLGTTLIVVTTPNGGFKVIDLEGHVAIKFLNGLRQYLNPGQMTFVLPSGTPSPIIVIRLHDLVKSSGLLNGFGHPLPSLALILAEVDKQLKLIDSGWAQDTGFYVGNDATPTTVQVVDSNTIKAEQTDDTGSSGLTSPPSTPPPTGVTISAPTLDPTYILNLGNGFGFIVPTTLPNIIINTPTIDLSPYATPTPFFEFLAQDALTINGSVVFGGLPAGTTSTLDLIAGTQLSIASGATVEADAGTFALDVTGSGGTILNGANLLDNATGGRILIGALGVTAPTVATFRPDAAASGVRTPSLSLTGGSVQAKSAVELFSTNGLSVNGTTLTAGSLVEINSLSGNIALTNPVINSGTGETSIFAGTSLTMNGGTINGNATSGDVFLSTGTGAITVQSTSITTSYLSLFSGDGILLDGTGATFNGGNSGTVSLTAAGASGGVLAVSNADFSSFSSVSMAANTINLTKVVLGSTNTVAFTCPNGVLAPNPNTGAASVAGDVNFIRNVTYNSQPAQNYVPTNQGGSYVNTSAPAPITITAGVP